MALRESGSLFELAVAAGGEEWRYRCEGSACEEVELPGRFRSVERT